MSAGLLAVELDEMRASLGMTRNDTGSWLCACGVALEAAETFSCMACRAAEERESRRRAQVAWVERWREEARSYVRFTSAPAFPFARLDNPEFLAKTKGKRLLKAAQAYKLEQNLVLSGPSGCGKTTVARALVHRIGEEAVAELLAQKPGTQATALLRRLKGLYWTDGFTLAKVRRQLPLGRGEADEVERAMECSVLVLDEVGFEQMYDTVIAEIADYRYRHNAITILTTGLRPAGFAERYGDACWRRFAERGAVVGEW